MVLVQSARAGKEPVSFGHSGIVRRNVLDSEHCTGSSRSDVMFCRPTTDATSRGLLQAHWVRSSLNSTEPRSQSTPPSKLSAAFRSLVLHRTHARQPTMCSWLRVHRTGAIEILIRARVIANAGSPQWLIRSREPKAGLLCASRTVRPQPSRQQRELPQAGQRNRTGTQRQRSRTSARRG